MITLPMSFHHQRPELRFHPMTDIWQSLAEALRLIVSIDGDLLEIILRSLQATLSAVVVASLIGLSLGALLAVRRSAIFGPNITIFYFH
ncbi:MAG: hypothetical protein GKR97_19765 [Rhizobiaceae bacterium]|nr:hypothetical protein [Rhizobiaceae bacterium]